MERLTGIRCNKQKILATLRGLKENTAEGEVDPLHAILFSK